MSKILILEANPRKDLNLNQEVLNLILLEYQRLTLLRRTQEQSRGI